jgi:hypothetical protein
MIQQDHKPPWMILEDLRFAWNGKDHGSKEMAL